MRKAMLYAALVFCVVFCLSLVGCALFNAPSPVINPDGTITVPADAVGEWVNTVNSTSPLIPGIVGGVIGLLTGLIQIIRQRRQIVQANDLSAVLVQLIQSAREDPKFAAKWGAIVKDVLEGNGCSIAQFTDLVNAIKEKYGIPSVG